MWKTIWEPCVLEYSNLRYVWFYISKSVCLLGGTLISPKSSIAMSHGKKGRSSQVIVEKSNTKSCYLYAYFHTLYTVIHTDTIPLFCSKPIYISRRGEEAKHSKMHGSLIVYTHGFLIVMIFWGRNYWTINYRNLSVRGLKPFFGQKLQFCNIVKLCISVAGITSLFCVCITKEMNGTTWSMHAWYYPEMQCQNQNEFEWEWKGHGRGPLNKAQSPARKYVQKDEMVMRHAWFIFIAKELLRPPWCGAFNCLLYCK